VLVNAVERGSPPEKAGLQAGDRILSINGKVDRRAQPIDVPHVQQMLAELPVDSTVHMRIERNGKQRDIELKALPQPPERAQEEALAAFGISGSQLTDSHGQAPQPGRARRRAGDRSCGLAARPRWRGPRSRPAR
jgi:serine protease Do